MSFIVDKSGIPSVSIIIPIYNGFKKLDEEVLGAEVSKEIILINDGSTDNSADACREYAEKIPEVVFVDKPHTGVSDTRNAGIRAAKGKYILFLDADDALKKGSVKSLVDFFERCYNAVDLVTYPLETRYNGYILAPHFRYRTLKRSGIYDMNLFPYIGQTTMNIMVKNLGEDNILFDTSMNFEEDQKYCCDVLHKKLKMGFCSEATYIYYRSEDSSSGKLSGSCYIFEQAMKMFETIFSRYSDTVPAAIQGLYINDLAWKMRSNLLYPWHYDKAQFAVAQERICKLLSRVDVPVIWEHPDIELYHKYYWLSQKPNSNVKTFFKNDSFGLQWGEKTLLEENSVQLILTRIRKEDEKVIFRGFFKSGVFSFSEKPEAYAVTETGRIKLDLYLSSHSYYFCHTQTNLFYGFCLELPLLELKSLHFQIRAGGYMYPCTCDFHQKASFSGKYQIYDTVIGKATVISFSPENETFSLSSDSPDEILKKNTRNPLINIKLARIRRKAIKLRKKKRIYLYYDCRGVEKDNGYYRFLEDFSKQDGIERYYISDPKCQIYSRLFTAKQRKHLIPFGSMKHKVYTLSAERIVTAYVEDNNILPFEPQQYPLIADFLGFTVEYLQHGVLHASVPWKYTPDSVMADKLCISTDYEQRLFTEKYHFRTEDLIVCPMARWKAMDISKTPQKKILFAPSWREYLIGPNVNGIWQPRMELFLQSDYYRNISAFLNSQKLHNWLEEHDYILEFKLHPIFSAYEKAFKSKFSRIRIVHSEEKPEEYDIFLTDFSSFAFDFLYLKRRVFSFIPDEMQFKCGMNSYREIEPESRESFIHVKSAEEFCEAVDSEQACKSMINFLF